MQTPPRFDFGPNNPPPAGTPPSSGSGGQPPYFPPPPYREEVSISDGTARSGLGKILPIIITISAFGGLALLGWFAYQEGRKPTAEGELPVIKADSEEFKREPENPGGEEIPHMDKEVYNSYSGEEKDGAAAKPQAEDPTEQPVDRNFLKQFAGQGEEEDAATAGALKQETVAFGEAPAPTPAEPVTAPEAPKPLAMDTATPNTGGVVTSPDEGQPEVLQPAETVPQAALPVAKDTEPKPVVIDEPETAPVKEVKKPEPVKKAPAKTEAKKTTSTKAVKSTDFRVQLGAFRSEAEAKAEWKRLQGKFKSDLGSLSMMTEKVDVPGKGIMFRLQAGPVKNKDAGRALCKKLSGQGCFVVQ